MAKTKEVEQITGFQAVSTIMSTEELARKIESLSGVEKKNFCFLLTKEQKKAYIDYCKERDTRMVTGTFHCFEPVGGSVTFTAKPYEGCEYSYTLEHGKQYTLPFCVALHFNDEWRGIGAYYATHKHILDAKGNAAYGVGKKNYRYAFSGNFN